MQHKFTYIFLLILILSSSFVVVKNSEVALSFTLETTQTAFEAGTTIVLKVATTKEIKPLLYCSNSYGSTLLTPIYENKILSYTFPSNISSTHYHFLTPILKQLLPVTFVKSGGINSEV